MSEYRRPAFRSAYHAALGVHLRSLRKQSGTGPTAFVRGFDLSEATVSKVERGRRAPSAHTLGIYCDALGVDLLDTLADAATRHRQEHDPLGIDPLEMPYFVRQLDGLAMFAEIPERYLPGGLLRPVDDGREGR